MIVDSQLAFQFLIPVSYNFSSVQCTAIFNMHAVLTIEYPHYIVFA